MDMQVVMLASLEKARRDAEELKSIVEISMALQTYMEVVLEPEGGDGAGAGAGARAQARGTVEEEVQDTTAFDAAMRKVVTHHEPVGAIADAVRALVTCVATCVVLFPEMGRGVVPRVEAVALRLGRLIVQQVQVRGGGAIRLEGGEAYTLPNPWGEPADVLRLRTRYVTAALSYVVAHTDARADVAVVVGAWASRFRALSASMASLQDVWAYFMLRERKEIPPPLADVAAVLDRLVSGKAPEGAPENSRVLAEVLDIVGWNFREWAAVEAERYPKLPLCFTVAPAPEHEHEHEHDAWDVGLGDYDVGLGDYALLPPPMAAAWATAVFKPLADLLSLHADVSLNASGNGW